MNEPLSMPSATDQLLAHFLQGLEKAPDRDCVLREFCAVHPDLAMEAQALAGMNEMVEQARPDNAEETPQRLGEYQVLRRIGRGGMGEIFEAWHERLHRRVAVKTIRQGRISPMARDRFM